MKNQPAACNGGLIPLTALLGLDIYMRKNKLKFTYFTGGGSGYASNARGVLVPINVIESRHVSRRVVDVTDPGRGIVGRNIIWEISPEHYSFFKKISRDCQLRAEAAKQRQRIWNSFRSYFRKQWKDVDAFNSMTLKLKRYCFRY